MLIAGSAQEITEKVQEKLNDGWNLHGVTMLYEEKSFKDGKLKHSRVIFSQAVVKTSRKKAEFFTLKCQSRNVFYKQKDKMILDGWVAYGDFLSTLSDVGTEYCQDFVKKETK